MRRALAVVLLLGLAGCIKVEVPAVQPAVPAADDGLTTLALSVVESGTGSGVSGTGGGNGAGGTGASGGNGSSAVTGPPGLRRASADVRQGRRAHPARAEMLGLA